MGQTLSAPVTTKRTDLQENDQLLVGSSCMQGWRFEMEDYSTFFLNMPGDSEAAFFAVYDGHGNGYVSKHASQRLHDILVKRPEYSQNVSLGLTKAFVEFDSQVNGKKEWSVTQAGTTANVVLIKNNRLYCANIGDSRAIACVNGRLEELSIDHKPNNPLEAKRIIEAGGWIEFNRVNGSLNLSRAFGDFMYKSNAHKTVDQQMVIPYPEVKVFDLNPGWEFFLMASDGIWDVMSNTAALEFVRQRLRRGTKPNKICEDLMDYCISPNSSLNNGLGCDNMTVILVCFRREGIHSNLKNRTISHSGSGDGSLKSSISYSRQNLSR